MIIVLPSWYDDFKDLILVGERSCCVLEVLEEMWF